ncbi:lipid A-modifier LpxR family protein [Halomonas sp. PR-M31]|uniref:lipid A-modifier LpxR family protein n=1 Tax=Halomonas sp. PR-M31 TaxID=1471202 RepID=UPI00209F7BF0|nr:lipid A-modifier LpxR family protein [Halomonas sp. PR-M31]
MGVWPQRLDECRQSLRLPGCRRCAALRPRPGKELWHSCGGARPRRTSGFVPDAGFGWYGFLGTEGRFMAHNLLLDGNTFESSHDVDRREWVGDLTAGVVFSWDRFQVALTNVWRTREFESQDEADQFGSITLSTWL